MANINWEGEMVKILAKEKLEKLFLGICGPFPLSGGNHRCQYTLILIHDFPKFIKLYPMGKANTTNILKNIL